MLDLGKSVKSSQNDSKHIKDTQKSYEIIVNQCLWGHVLDVTHTPSLAGHAEENASRWRHPQRTTRILPTGKVGAAHLRLPLNLY